MLTGAPIMAIVATTVFARAKTFYGRTLGFADANLPMPGPQVVYRCGGNTLLVSRPRRQHPAHPFARRDRSHRVRVALLRGDA
jgi:hypothetical protein